MDAIVARIEGGKASLLFKEYKEEGYVLQLAFSVPDQYPLQPPQVRFLTKIFHLKVHFKFGITILKRCSYGYNFDGGVKIDGGVKRRCRWVAVVTGLVLEDGGMAMTILATAEMMKVT
ncbi:unnamed protein product [Sphenostylis stenocarpa]|uniref:UBC core domain-containing protein n=1 Tax=Sphenostylis stenocarpa TaxID=92480 RepID=A0AA86SZ90_9FABA|nr:unnamed protein product [Sphenostylis stenocarpa]